MEVSETMDYWYDIVERKHYQVKVTRRWGPHQIQDMDGQFTQVQESVTFESIPPIGRPIVYIEGNKAVKADIAETVEDTTEVVSGKEYPLKITRWKGLHEITDLGGRTVLSDQTVFFDAGPKRGISRTTFEHRETPYTEAEREEGRRNIQRVVAQCMRAQGIW